MNTVDDSGFTQYKSPIAGGMNQFLAGNQAKPPSILADLNDLIYIVNYVVERASSSNHRLPTYRGCQRFTPESVTDFGEHLGVSKRVPWL